MIARLEERVYKERRGVRPRGYDCGRREEGSEERAGVAEARVGRMELLGPSAKIALRGIMRWQSMGGAAYVADVHRRMLECWRYHGNETHESKGKSEVSEEEFIDAVLHRHGAGSGIASSVSGYAVEADDF